MKYIAEFRDTALAQGVLQKIKEIAAPDRHYKLMEFCGGHTHTLHRYAIPQLLPKNVEMVHGPGCPVCVLPIARIDHAIAIAQKPNVIFCSYGDMLRVPGTQQHSLLKAKAMGADIRMVYSIDDALNLARLHPDRDVVFFAIGFETTTPPTAVAILQAQKEQLKNFSVFCNHVLTPIAMQAILSPADLTTPIQIDGFVGPAHVSLVIGAEAYRHVAETYQKPIVISGFEPLDLLESIYLLIELINLNRVDVINQYRRAVTPHGNVTAQEFTLQVLELRDTFEWRGLGFIPESALKIRAEYQEFDAELRYAVNLPESYDHKQCECGAILRGQKKPTDCKLFATACTPENPLGSCMVSSEGACAAYFQYQGR